MGKIFGCIMRIVGLAVIAVLMIPTIILISAIRLIFAVSDSAPDRRQ